MVQLSNSSHNTIHRKDASQVSIQAMSKQVFLPDGKSKQKATNGNNALL